MLPNLHPHDRVVEDLELRVRLVPFLSIWFLALELQAGELEKCLPALDHLFDFEISIIYSQIRSLFLQGVTDFIVCLRFWENF